MSTININGLDKAEVLLALYHGGKYQGISMLGAGGMTPETAKKLVEDASANPRSDYEKIYFDYCMGRVIKTDIGFDDLDPRLYDRDNGQGAAAAALKHLLDARDAKPAELYLAGKLKYPAKQEQIDQFKAKVAAGKAFAEVDRPVRLPDMSDGDWAARFNSIDEQRICAQITHVEVDANGWVSVAIKPCGPQRDAVEEGGSLSFGVRAIYANESALIVTVDLAGVDLQA